MDMVAHEAISDYFKSHFLLQYRQNIHHFEVIIFLFKMMAMVHAPKYNMI
jgi:hypothetical protein